VISRRKIPLLASFGNQEGGKRRKRKEEKKNPKKGFRNPNTERGGRRKKAGIAYSEREERGEAEGGAKRALSAERGERKIFLLEKRKGKGERSRSEKREMFKNVLLLQYSPGRVGERKRWREFHRKGEGKGGAQSAQKRKKRTKKGGGNCFNYSIFLAEGGRGRGRLISCQGGEKERRGKEVYPEKKGLMQRFPLCRGGKRERENLSYDKKKEKKGRRKEKLKELPNFTKGEGKETSPQLLVERGEGKGHEGTQKPIVQRGKEGEKGEGERGSLILSHKGEGKEKRKGKKGEKKRERF